MTVTTMIFQYDFRVCGPGEFDEQYHRISGLKAIRTPVLVLYGRGIHTRDSYSSVLMRIHGFYPYLFTQVPYKIVMTITDLADYKKHFAHDLENCVLELYPQLTQQINGVVHDIQFVSALPFTGYHAVEQLFLKIFVTEYDMVPIVAKALQSGKMSSAYLPFEAHIDVFTKFVNDLSLDISKPVVFQNCIPGRDVQVRQSTCDHEYDCLISDIQSNKTGGECVYQAMSQTDYMQLQRQRREMLALFWERCSHSQQTNDEAGVVISEEDNSRSSQGKTAAAQLVGDDANIDIDALQRGLDGGSGSIDVEVDEDDALVGQPVQTDIERQFTQLHYSKVEDIPSGEFYQVVQELAYREEAPETEDQPLSVSSRDDSQEIALVQTVQRQDTTILRLDTDLLARLRRSGEPRSQRPTTVDFALSQDDLLSKIKVSIENIKTQLSPIVSYLKICQIEVSLLEDAIVLQHYDSNGINMAAARPCDIVRHSHFNVFIDSERINSTEYDTLQQRLIALFGDHQEQRACSIQFHYASMQTILTQKLVQVIHESDPDVLISYRNDCSGLENLVRIASEKFNFNLAQFLGRTPGEQVQPCNIRKNDLCVCGRVVVTLMHVCRSLFRLEHYQLHQILKHMDIGRYCSINGRVVDVVANSRSQLINCNTCFADGYYDIDFDSEYDIPNQGSRTRLYQHQAPVLAAQMVMGATRVAQQISFIPAIQRMMGMLSIPFGDVLFQEPAYKVEAFLFREARAHNFILGPSLTRHQIVQMRTTKQIPFIAEPISQYCDYPVLAYDFPGLYPSVIAQFNLCYSTMLCDFSQAQKIGPFNLRFDSNQFASIDVERDVYYSPSKCIFVKQNVRKGVLPTIIQYFLEMQQGLDQRKQTLNSYKSEITSYQRLEDRSMPASLHGELNDVLANLNCGIAECHAVQRVLNLLRNEVYKYTAPSFGNRMPCQLLSETISGISKQVLEYIIKYVERHYTCQVVYADTFGIFVDTKSFFQAQTPVSRRDILTQALDLGKRILSGVNSQIAGNINLEFQKIYFPCIFVARKRYVGQSYSTDMLEGVQCAHSKHVTSQIESRGIESAGGGLPRIAQRFVNRCITTLFSSSDLSELKRYIACFTLEYCLQEGVLCDFIFDKKAAGTPEDADYTVQGRKWEENDYLVAPQYEDRKQCVVIKQQGKGLLGSTMAPCEMYQLNVNGQQRYRINYSYYFEQQLIRRAQRLFGSCNIDVMGTVLEVGLFVLRNQQLLNSIAADSCRLNQMVQYFSKSNYGSVSYRYNYLLRIILEEDLFHVQRAPLISTVLSGFNFCLQSRLKVQIQDLVLRCGYQCIICDDMCSNIIGPVVICESCLEEGLQASIAVKGMLVGRRLRSCMWDLQCAMQQCSQCCQSSSFCCGNYECDVFQRIFKLRRQIITMGNNYECIRGILAAKHIYFTTKKDGNRTIVGDN